MFNHSYNNCFIKRYFNKQMPEPKQPMPRPGTPMPRPGTPMPRPGTPMPQPIPTPKPK